MSTDLQRMRFSDAAKAVMEKAIKEAEADGTATIHPEHLLLGLVDLGPPALKAAMRDAGMEAETIRSRWQRVDGESDSAAVGDETRPSAACSRVLDSAYEICRQTGVHVVEPAHLLFAIVSSDSGRAFDCLVRLMLINWLKQGCK